MHWSDEIAQKIIARRPDKEEYVCAAGISPSGSVHIGNFRDIATSFFVVKALERAGKKALVICTVSNNIPAGIELPSEDRQNGFKDMARLALEMSL